MTGLSARRSSASEALAVPAGGELHLWLCRRETMAGSDQFLRITIGLAEENQAVLRALGDYMSTH